MSSIMTNRVAIVTGGTGFLGRVIVKRFASEGYKVYVPFRSLEKFKLVFSVKDEPGTFSEFPKIYGLPCDAFEESEVRTFCDNVYTKERRIDSLINTIGGYHPKTTIGHMSMDLINSQKKLNFDTIYYFSKHALTYMKINKFGRVISVSAKAALESTAGKFAYSFSKQAVINLMGTLAEENKDFDITFNTLIPEIIDTPPNRESMPSADFNKWIKCDEIASLCVYLSSEDSGKINSNVFRLFCK